MNDTAYFFRILTLPSGKYIIWEMFIEAYNWDQGNMVQINKNLKKEHFYLTSASKMKNHLADQVLDESMLVLMIAYAEHLGPKGKYVLVLQYTLQSAQSPTLNDYI